MVSRRSRRFTQNGFPLISQIYAEWFPADLADLRRMVSRRSRRFTQNGFPQIAQIYAEWFPADRADLRRSLQVVIFFSEDVRAPTHWWSAAALAKADFFFRKRHLRKSARSAGNKIRTKENPWENFRIVMSET